MNGLNDRLRGGKGIPNQEDGDQQGDEQNESRINKAALAVKNDCQNDREEQQNRRDAVGVFGTPKKADEQNDQRCKAEKEMLFHRRSFFCGCGAALQLRGCPTQPRLK